MDVSHIEIPASPPLLNTRRFPFGENAMLNMDERLLLETSIISRVLAS
jgi:hypothetical protein